MYESYLLCACVNLVDNFKFRKKTCCVESSKFRFRVFCMLKPCIWLYYLNPENGFIAKTRKRGFITKIKMLQLLAVFQSVEYVGT